LPGVVVSFCADGCTGVADTVCATLTPKHSGKTLNPNTRKGLISTAYRQAGGQAIPSTKYMAFLLPLCYAQIMQITVQLPDDLAQHADPAREALEAFAIEGYRTGALSTHQTRILLGFGTRYELDGFLKSHQVWERSYGAEEYEKDMIDVEKPA
jgi:hypothetical protein